MNIKNKVFAKQLIIYTLTDLISRALPFLIFPVVITFLSPSEFGIVTNFNVLVQIFSAFIGLHLGTYLSANFYNSSNARIQTILSSIIQIYFIIFCLILLIVFFLNDFLLNIFHISKWQQFLALFTVFFSSVSGIVTSYFRLIEKVKFFALFTLSNVLITTLLTFIFLKFWDLGVEGRIYAIVIPNLIFGLFSIFYLFGLKLTSNRVDKHEVLKQIKFGLPMLPHTLSFWFKTGLDRLLITNTVGLLANGIFSLSATFGSIFFLFNNAFNNAYVPSLYKRLSKKDISIDEKKQIVKEIYLYVFVYFIAQLFGFFAIRFTILIYFAKYSQSITYLPYFLVFNILNVLYQVSVNFIFFEHKTKYIGLLTFTTSVMQAVLSYLLLGVFGLHGVGISMVISSFLLFVTTFVYSNRVYKMPWLLKIF